MAILRITLVLLDCTVEIVNSRSIRFSPPSYRESPLIPWTARIVMVKYVTFIIYIVILFADEWIIHPSPR